MPITKITSISNLLTGRAQQTHKRKSLGMCRAKGAQAVILSDKQHTPKDALIRCPRKAKTRLMNICIRQIQPRPLRHSCPVCQFSMLCLARLLGIFSGVAGVESAPNPESILCSCAHESNTVRNTTTTSNVGSYMCAQSAYLCASEFACCATWQS